MIWKDGPPNFNPRFEVVSIFCEHEGKIILLQRNGSKPQGGTWGVPAGKIEKGEYLEQAILREMEQETGIKLDKAKIDYFNKLFVRYPEYDFVYHIFHTKLREGVDVFINPKEHVNYAWKCPEEALEMPLIQDLDECIRLFYDVE